MTTSNNTLKNDSSKAGQLAAPKQVFGDFHRYAVAPVHCRVIPGITEDAVSWFVWDADVIDPITEGPEVIRQEATREEAVAGLV